MRILGKGKTALAIGEVFPEVKFYDDYDKESFDIQSDELTVVSPGIPPHNYLVQNTKNIISDYDLFLDETKFTIWISGTNGKTTTTSMLYHLLQQDGFSCGGNIGTPLASVKDKQKLILETSSFTLHYTSKAKPNIYILLPITPDHLYWHGDMSEYEKAKLKPLSTMDKNGIAIIPKKYQNYQTEAVVYYYEDTQELAKLFHIDMKQINFREPFLQDAVLALIGASLYNNKIDYQIINSFVQDPHKLEEFTDSTGNVWVDDSKATNIDATIQALKTYREKNINLILGGDDKGVDLNPLFEEIKKYKVIIFAIGSNTDKLSELSKKYNVEFVTCHRLEEAVNQIIQSPKFKAKNSINILSPAAASLDQFNSYAHRGDEFKRLITEKNGFR